MADYNLVTCDSLFAKIEAQLSIYGNNGLLDTNTFFSEVKLIINKLGVAAYEMVESVVTLENYKSALPCNFYLLDSAWLCDENRTYSQNILQSNFVMYTETTKETICQDTCGNDELLSVLSNGVTVQSTACNNNNEHILDKVTIKEYITTGSPREFTWRNPVLLTLNNKKSVGGDVCVGKCKNLFAKSPYEISIAQQGANKFLHSTLKEPVIYLKYYAYPEDAETGLPLIPDEPVIQRAIEYQLMYYFFYMTWLNGNDVNIERKVQDLEVKRDKYLREALNYSVIPSFRKTTEMARNVRKKFSAYELLNSKHY